MLKIAIEPKEELEKSTRKEGHMLTRQTQVNIRN
uniref:Uncharacterized protein n=1 Tax=Arundo donax TaxID=35708 RepID=A0A0A9SKB1_ARUDO